MLVGSTSSTFLVLEGGQLVLYGYFSPLRTEHEIPYHHLCSIRPITHQFAKVVRLILGIQHLPYASRKPKSTPTRVIVSSMEEVVLTTLEGLEESIEDREEPLICR